MDVTSPAEGYQTKEFVMENRDPNYDQDLVEYAATLPEEKPVPSWYAEEDAEEARLDAEHREQMSRERWGY